MLRTVLLTLCFRSAFTTISINGGSIVDQATMTSKYPWFVSLVEFRDGECVPSCGGAMVAPGTFVTAAHCLADNEPTPVLSEQFAVIGFAGSYDFNQQDFPNPCNPISFEAFIKKSSPHAMVRAIDNFKKPIHYNRVPGYDIMLVFLSESACPTKGITMPTVNILGQCGEVIDWISDEKKVTLLGFGATMGEEGRFSDVLKKLDTAVHSIGTSDDICNLDVAQDESFPSIVCSRETPASKDCVDRDGYPSPDADGCVPGVKGASGDSGGPWVTDVNGQIVKAFTQSSGQVNDDKESYGYLIRDAWFQDFIHHGIKHFDKCGGSSMTEDDIFVGFGKNAQSQYCQGNDCGACMDSVVTKHDCLQDYLEPGATCAIAPNVAGCTTIPTIDEVAEPTCELYEQFISGSTRDVFAKFGVVLFAIARLL